MTVRTADQFRILMTIAAIIAVASAIGVVPSVWPSF
jgi:hypothetical protein